MIQTWVVRAELTARGATRLENALRVMGDEDQAFNVSFERPRDAVYKGARCRVEGCPGTYERQDSRGRSRDSEFVTRKYRCTVCGHAVSQQEPRERISAISGGLLGRQRPARNNARVVKNSSPGAHHHRVGKTKPGAVGGTLEQRRNV